MGYVLLWLDNISQPEAGRYVTYDGEDVKLADCTKTADGLKEDA